MKTRRQFLTSTSTALAGLAFGPAAIAAGATSAAQAALAQPLNHAAFAALVATAFQVRPTAAVRNQRLRLNAAQLKPDPSGECFVLSFSGSREHVLPQGTYQFEHERLGAFAMFIVPGRRTDSGQDYHAVFNRCA